MNAYDIIRRPVLSEKSYAGIPGKRYTFEVAQGANKIEIAQAIEKIFDVKVEKVNTVNVSGKMKRQGRHAGLTSKWKKAIVHLTDDSKPIEFFESLT
ncbi:MAG: 50S ribosomal protein L23 [Clostridia bacterium]|nr:50S ribosomal protein L23 [Clostridia bacterium]